MNKTATQKEKKPGTSKKVRGKPDDELMLVHDHNGGIVKVRKSLLLAGQKVASFRGLFGFSPSNPRA